MGLQTWPRRKPPLSSMACLDVEAPTICRVLQLRLQQRRTREQLVDQGIMPPLKTPAAFHEQIRSLERARTGNFLKHKICSRPERSELVRMHILQETQAVASLQATQMKLKRARLTDDLNEKIAQRPGPMELVVKNILPVDTGVKEAVIDSKETKTLDVYNFDEDSSDALSPERPASQESQSSVCTPPRELRMPEPPSISPGVNSTVKSPPTSQSTSDVFNITKEQQSTCVTTTAQPNPTVVTTTTPGPVLIKQSQPKTPSDKNRSKKSKEPKPRVKKLKYHQYIPPDQKQELSEMPMDSAYACLLQQQQQFLQLQILSQQQQHFSYQAILPAPLKSGTDSQNSCPQVALNGNGLSTSHVISLPGVAPVRPNGKPDHLPANLEEMKVAELKLELKRRGLPVSGTKTDLIERLKSYQENCNIPPANATDMTATTVAPQSENTNSSPPVSPVASKVSSGPGIEESGITAGSPSPATSRSSPQRPPREEESPAESRPSEKDKRLHEKELQIEELRRKLEQEQRLVEELRMQLEVEKRNQQGESPPRPSPPPNPIQVKVENESPPNCTGPCSPPGRPVVIKQDPDQSQLAPPTHQFMISHQQVNKALAGQPEPQLADHQPGTQLLAAAAAAAVTIQLPDSSIELQPSVSSAIPEVSQSPGSGLQKPEASTAVQKHCTAHTQPVTQTGLLGDSPGSGFPFRADQSQTTGGDAPQHLLNDFLGSGSSSPGRAHSTLAVSKAPTHKCLGPSQPMPLIPKFANHGSKSKDPPCYEDAVKQTRSMHIAVQVPSAASQHMDDLFDVLIESGEISPFTKPDLPSLDKLLPVTASVTTLPINTVLSRPPPQIQVAQLPAPARNRPPSLVALAADGPLETLLGASLAGDEEPRTLRLMEELLEHPNSPMDYTSPSSSSSSSSFHLQSNNLDNMEWLDLTLPAATGELNPLGVSSSVCGVFSEDFLDSHELQLNWD